MPSANEKKVPPFTDESSPQALPSTVARRLRAEKQAQVAPVKMLFPIVFFLFPAFIIVMLLPPFLKIAAFFGGTAR